MRFLLSLLLSTALALPPFVHAQNLPDLGESSQAEFSPHAERELGQSIMSRIRRDPAYIDDPEVAAYISGIGQRLAAATPETAGIDFHFFAVRDPNINAFALPGGYIGVHSGLVTAAMTESEFASVLAHEIAHVSQRHIARQLQAQSQIGALSMIGMVIAMLAASSNPQVAEAAAVAGSAAPVAAFLNYSREFEREADRLGYQILRAAEFDVHAMPSFFERLQRSTRLYENNAPGYLRTHPLTTERIADMQHRTREERPARMQPDSRTFQIVRAKLRAEQGDASDAAAFFREALADRRYADRGAARYGYVVALLRMGDVATARAQWLELRKAADSHPMYETVGARVYLAAGEPEEAVRVLQRAVKKHPHNDLVRVAYADVLQQAHRHQEAVSLLSTLRSERPGEPRFYQMLAKSYAGLGQRVEQHRALAEYYYLTGSLPGAIQQLELAQSAKDADFYTLSAVDARLRQLRAQQLQEMKERQR
ncbi:MAG TPA: M48 family metalloprotease [Burkholderiales bacterium]|nr:M48 family metalloprotease [Burkholderiales bacterium]